MRIVWLGDEAKRIAREAAVQALKDGADAILTESHMEVPHDTGTLQRSGTVTPGTQNGKPVVYISYNTPYARRLHEHPEYRFREGRKAKYLEDPFKRLQGKVVRLANARVRAALKKGR